MTGYLSFNNLLANNAIIRGNVVGDEYFMASRINAQYDLFNSIDSHRLVAIGFNGPLKRQKASIRLIFQPIINNLDDTETINKFNNAIKIKSSG